MKTKSPVELAQINSLSDFPVPTPIKNLLSQAERAKKAEEKKRWVENIKGLTFASKNYSIINFWHHLWVFALFNPWTWHLNRLKIALAAVPETARLISNILNKYFGLDPELSYPVTSFFPGLVPKLWRILMPARLGACTAPSQGPCERRSCWRTVARCWTRINSSNGSKWSRPRAQPSCPRFEAWPIFRSRPNWRICSRSRDPDRTRSPRKKGSQDIQPKIETKYDWTNLIKNHLTNLIKNHF